VHGAGPAGGGRDAGGGSDGAVQVGAKIESVEGFCVTRVLWVSDCAGSASVRLMQKARGLHLISGNVIYLFKVID
jgi:hypothetical protein